MFYKYFYEKPNNIVLLCKELFCDKFIDYKYIM